MVMETTLRRDMPIDELRTLGIQLQALSRDIPLTIRCTVKDGRLVVLGQHAADVVINSTAVLEQLERAIQSQALQFTKQVRLYLRITGQKHPYAHHRFLLTSPSPQKDRPQSTTLEPNKPVSWLTATTITEVTVKPVQRVTKMPELQRKGKKKAIASSLQSVSSGAAAAISPPTVPLQQPLSQTANQTANHLNQVPEQPWIVGDAELSALVEQLTSRSSDALCSSLRLSDNGLDNGNDWLSRDRAELESDQLGQKTATPLISSPLVSTPLTSTPRLNVEQSGGTQWDEAPSQKERLDKNQQEEDRLGHDDFTHDRQDKIQGEEQSTPILPLGNVDFHTSEESVAAAITETVMETTSETGAVLENGLIPNAAQLVLSEWDRSEQGPRRGGADSLQEASDPHRLDEIPLALPAVGMATAQPFQDFTYETSQQLRELAHLFPSNPDLTVPDVPATAHVETSHHRRVAIAAASLATLSVAVGLYGATRPCVVGYCQALTDATALGDKSIRLMEQAQTWADVELTRVPLTQAIEALDPIPSWSSHNATVQQQRTQYSTQLDQIDQLMGVDHTIQQADQIAHQSVYTPDDLQTVRSLWASAVEQLQTIPANSPLYDFAQQHIATYHPNLTQAEQQVSREKAAAAILETAKQAAQLAQARQGIAQTLEHWQFARVTWIVALDRLNQVPGDTFAAGEAERLRVFYQNALDEANVHIEQEKVISAALTLASQQAELAIASENRHDWKQAIADWTSALDHIQTINTDGHSALKVDELQTHYQNSLTQAQDKLAAQSQIEGELKQACVGELKLCDIISVGQPIKLQLDASYLDAINTARNNNNYNLQAVVTDHQLMVRDSLDRIANSFEVEIEVYNPDGGLLERHMPAPNE